MGNQMRFKRRNIIKDRISEMPDDILSFILSLLPMREAARTSILSCRWKFLWKTSVTFSSSLSLDVLAMRGSDYCEDCFGVLEKGSYKDNRKLLSIERLKFVEWVDQILQLDYVSVIDSFRLRYFFKKDFAYHIDQWINMAISKRVQNFHINLSHFHFWGFCRPNEDLYKFPIWLFTQETGSLVKCLCLTSCVLGPLDINCFSSLVDLQLSSVLINQNGFVSFLSNCPNLEKLCLVKCSQLLGLKFSGAFLKLKYLAIIACCSLKYIEINARSLTKLEYGGDLVDFSFVNVPQLSDVTINFRTINLSILNNLTPNLSSHLTKLESLMLAVMPIESAIIPGVFAQLKKLVLLIAAVKGSIWEFIPLLNASPQLDTLELHWWFRPVLSDEEVLVQKPSDSPHRCLKHITITGFTGSRHEVEVMTYLVNNATALKDITVRYRATNYNYMKGFFDCGFSASEDAEVAEERRKMKERGSQQLMNVVPHGVNLLLL